MLSGRKTLDDAADERLDPKLPTVLLCRPGPGTAREPRAERERDADSSAANVKLCHSRPALRE